MILSWKTKTICRQDGQSVWALWATVVIFEHNKQGRINRFAAARVDRYANHCTASPCLDDVRDDNLSGAMFTKDILFGMNLLTPVGLLMTGFGLTLHRAARAELPYCVGFMGVGTVLVLVGLYASGWPR